MKASFYRIFSVSVVPVFLLLLLLFPALSLEGARRGLLLWFQKVVPSLLPFLILTNLMTITGSVQALSRRLSPACSRLGIHPGLLYPLFAGLFCGYPMGAKACADSVREGSLSLPEAQRLLPCCSLPSPMFLTGYLGAGLFSLSSAGRRLFLLAVYLPLPLLWLFGGLFFPKKEKKAAGAPSVSKKPAFLPALEEAMLQSFETLEKIGGYMILCSILTVFLSAWLPRTTASLFLAGSMEMTSGSALAAEGLSFPLNLSMALFFTVSGGLCIAAQTGSVLGGSGLKLPPFLAAKLLHGGLSALVFYGYAIFYLSSC